MAFRRHGAVGSETDVNARFLSLKAGKGPDIPTRWVLSWVGSERKASCVVPQQLPKTRVHRGCGRIPPAERGGLFLAKSWEIWEIWHRAVRAGDRCGHTQLNLVPARARECLIRRGPNELQ